MYRITLERKGKLPTTVTCDDFEITSDLEVIKIVRKIRNTEFVHILFVDDYVKVTIIPLNDENHRA